MRLFSGKTALTLAWTSTAITLLAAPARAGLKLQRVAHGLSRPVYVTAEPSHPLHIYVAEQWTGKIFRVDPQTESMQLFFTVPGLANGYAAGLVGFAFHPAYAAGGGKFYVSILTGTDPLTSRIREYTVSGTGSVGSPRDLLVYQQPHGAHNNTWIGFGPDGMLYINSGDGGDQYGGTVPPLNRSQRLNSLFGKIFRIDVNTQDPGLQYRIPDNDPPTGETPNPFVGSGGQPYRDSFGNAAQPEIWAFGFRSPWRASFDRLTGDLYIGDVGQFLREWIDVIPAGTRGQNFGWCVREGTLSTAGTPDMSHCQTETSAGPMVAPIYEYVHAESRNCLIGGYVYRGDAAPWLRGTYFYADNGSDQIYSLRYDTQQGALTAWIDRTDELRPSPGDVPPRPSVDGPSSFGEDLCGEHYIVAYRTGDVYRIVPHLPFADLDRDTDVDLDDFDSFAVCVTGPEQGPPAPACEDRDFDGDRDVDLGDFGLFQRCISGEDTPADQDCAG